MSRLIDADALKEAMSYNGDCGICLRYVDDAPTVNAIPVEWLKAHKTVYYEDWGAVPLLIEEVLTMWQKEQEAQDG